MRYVLVVGVGIAVILTGVASCQYQQRKKPPPGAIALQLPRGTAKRPQGLKALDVRPGVQPFTREQIAEYLHTHRLAKSDTDPARIRVDDVEIISAGQATARLRGAASGLPDDERVAFVTISGPLVFTGPPGSAPAHVDRAYALFDARSGNLLMSGTLDSPKAAGGKGHE